MGLLALLGTAVSAATAAGAKGSPGATDGRAAAPLPGLAAAARQILGPDQGVYVQSADGTVLLAQAATRAVHPASVSKVPTSLALLRRLGPDYRFETRFLTDGQVRQGVLHGDLIVQGAGDPSLVDEDALLVAERLQGLGIERIEGTLQVRGGLTFDWKPDPDGVHLRTALTGAAPTAAWSSVRTVLLTAGDANGAPETAPHIVFVPTPAPEAIGVAANAAAAGSAHGMVVAPVSDSGAPGAGATHALIVNRSQPLLPLLKSLNDYSNNIFSPLAAAAGGAASVQMLARSIVPASMRSEITLGDGAGEDPRNRLSPRAAVTLLQALDAQLRSEGHALYDLLPVAGIDDGTLHDRLNGPNERGRVVGKTGTYGSYGASALVGAIRTTDRGTVYFAILDHGVPVPEARRHQDQFVRALLKSLHTLPWDYQRDTRPAIARAQVLIVAPGRRS